MMTQSDKNLLASLPYRIGVWISHADDEAGEFDDEQEMKALEAIIKSIASLHDDAPFVQKIAKETLKQRDNWPEWTMNSFNVNL